jgi:uncharacterized protein YkwD
MTNNLSTKKTLCLLLTSLTLFTASLSAQESRYETTTASTKLSCEEARFVKLLNFYRARLKVHLLSVAYYGVEAARWHASDMALKSYFSHTEPNGRFPFDRMKFFKYPGEAENIAAGQSDANRVFCSWKNSPGHDRNMKNPRWTTVSIGLAKNSTSKFKTYWNSGFSSKPTELIGAPLQAEANCSMPTSLPNCS